MKYFKLVVFVYLSVACFSCNSNKTKPNIITSDSISVFDPSGYYLTSDSITIGNYDFDNLSILTEVQKENEQSVKIDKVFIQLIKIGTGSIKRLEFKNYTINRNNLILSCNDKELGNVSLIGSFITKNGPINDNDIDDETVVLKAKLKVNNDTENNIDFTWYVGD